jgi:branched-chain amino acid transport system ATP-binding protein
MSDRPLLEIKNLHKNFGKFHALNGVSLKVPQGCLTALIGPNGAGKTTFYNVISGRYKPSSGSVWFQGNDVSGLPNYKLAAMGLLRSFQITNIFPELTVLENVLTPVIIHHQSSFSMLGALRRRSDFRGYAEQILDSVGLLEFSDKIAASLAYGDKRLIEIAIVLALKPKLILLDEPTAGMNPEETDRITQLVKKLSRTSGATFIVTEHDMKVVFSIADRILVLNQGKTLAFGTPDEIRADPLVKQAYLGGSFDAKCV